MPDEADRVGDRMLALETGRQADAAARAAAALAGAGADICAECGEPIPPARRAALPAATRCRDCQADAERGR